MNSFLRVIGALASADVLFRTVSMIENLSIEAEILADKLEGVEMTLKEN